jgi:hypothetical protein
MWDWMTMWNNRTTIQPRLMVLVETNVISEPIQLTGLSGAGRPIEVGHSHQPVLDQEQP